jgi:hypothetical protein
MVGADDDPSLTAEKAGQLAMLQILLVGLGAGAAAALLFASVASGSILATLLFYLAPLPILIAVLGWNHLAGLVASLTAAAGLGATLGLYFFGAFLIGVGLPAWWLGYLALLARPVGANGSMTTEWYPSGRLVLWAAIIGAALVIIAIPNFGTDKESFQAGLRAAFEHAIEIQSRPSGPALGADAERVIDILVAAIPPAAAVLATIINVFNLWFAGRIVRVSGRLRRPWPDLSAITLPPTTLGVLAIAIAGTFLPDLPGIACRIVAASLFMAYAILGFAVLHALTRDLSFRPVLLIAAYGAVIVLGWPVVAAAFLGLADAAFNIRARRGGSRAPPPPTPSS